MQMDSEQPIEELQAVIKSSEAVEHNLTKSHTVRSSAYDATENKGVKLHDLVVEEYQSTDGNGDDLTTDPLIATADADLQCCGCICLCLEYLFCIKAFRNISFGSSKVCECIVDCRECAMWCVDCDCKNCNCDCRDCGDCNCDCDCGDCIDTCCTTV